MTASQQQQPQVRSTEKPTTVVGEVCEFTTTQEHLTKALRSLSGVAGRNPALPILNNVLLKRDENQLRLSTTDLEVGVTAWLPGKLRGNAALTIPLRSLTEYVQNLPIGPVALRVASGALTITTQGTHAVFQGESAENFPLIPHFESGTTLTLPPKELASAFDSILYAAATDDTRPELAGAFLSCDGQTLTLATTDSYRLAETQLPLPNSSSVSVIIPARAAQESRRALDGATEAQLRVGRGQLLFLTPTLHVISRQVEGTYPDYQSIIPSKQPTTIKADRVSLLRAIRAAAVFSGNTVSRVTLEVTDDKLRVSATTPEVGETETELAAEVSGQPVAIAFNERFLREALGALSSERVMVGLGSSATPAVFYPMASERVKGKKGEASVSVRSLIMPIKT